MQPPSLIYEIPPTGDELLTNIKDWVIYQLIQTAQSDPHYENTLYGPINGLLGEIFPLSRRYMVIPQALLRRPLTEEEVDDDLANVSFGSTGARHESRELPGTEHFRQFPDFAIVKVTPQPGIARNHYIVGIVEVKKAASHGDADRQMIKYMERAAQLPNSANPLYGYLVMGDVVKKFIVRRSRRSDAVFVKEVNSLVRLSKRENAFFSDLCEVSATYWNYPLADPRPIPSVRPR